MTYDVENPGSGLEQVKPLLELLRNRLSFFDTSSLQASSINQIVYFKNAVLPAI
jgi:hypothetical protein